MTSRVFVIQIPTRRPNGKGMPEVTRDLSPATKFGELIYLLSPSANPLHRPDLLLQDVRLTMDEHGFGKDDWLLLAGSTALIAMVSVEAVDRTDGLLRMLHWHGKMVNDDGSVGTYIPVEVDYDLDRESVPA